MNGEISKPFTMIDPKTNKEVVAIVKVKSKYRTTNKFERRLSNDKAIYENKNGKFLHDWIIKSEGNLCGD